MSKKKELKVRIRVVEEKGELNRRKSVYPKHIRSKTFYPTTSTEQDYDSILTILTRLGFRPSGINK